MLEDAKILQDAGAFCLVLEMVPETLAQEITESLSIPTIGIGAGRFCDGQVLVLHDMLGANEKFSPKFLKKYANFYEMTKNAVEEYNKDVKEGKFPGEENIFK